MGAYTLMIATACYVVTAVDLYFKGNPFMAGMWFFYSCANTCVMLEAYYPETARFFIWQK